MQEIDRLLVQLWSSQKYFELAFRSQPDSHLPTLEQALRVFVSKNSQVSCSFPFKG